LTRLAGNALTFSVNIPARLGAIDRDFVAETMSAVEALIIPLGCTASVASVTGPVALFAARFVKPTVTLPCTGVPETTDDGTVEDNTATDKSVGTADSNRRDSNISTAGRRLALLHLLIFNSFNLRGTPGKPRDCV